MISLLVEHLISTGVAAGVALRFFGFSLPLHCSLFSALPTMVTLNEIEL